MSNATEKEGAPSNRPAVRGAKAASRKIDAARADDHLSDLRPDGEPVRLGVGKKTAAKLERGEKSFTLEQPAAFDIDEPLPVGQAGLGTAEARARALDPHNRQLLDPVTNRRIKHLGVQVPVDEVFARNPDGSFVHANPETSAPRKPVSVAQDPEAIFTRRFDEVVEMKQVFGEAVRSIDPERVDRLRPTALKDEINRKVRQIIQNGETPAGEKVRDAMAKCGMSYEEGRGLVFTQDATDPHTATSQAKQRSAQIRAANQATDAARGKAEGK